MGVCQSADEVLPVNKNSRTPGKKNTRQASSAEERFVLEDTQFEENHNQIGREEAWLESTANTTQDQAKVTITDAVCPSCAAPVLAQSLRPLHHENGEEGDSNTSNPLRAVDGRATSPGSHFVCAICWESFRRATLGSEQTSSACIFCLVQPVLDAIQKYSLCDVTFARWLRVIASCTGQHNRLLCAASIIANSVEPTTLASFTADAPKETASGMIVSIACILESLPKPLFASVSQQTVSPSVVQLWVEAKDSLLTSILEMKTPGEQAAKMKILCPPLTRLYLRVGLLYRSLTLAGLPVESTRCLLHQIALCTCCEGLEGLDDTHYSVESIKRASPGLNYDILSQYPPFMFQ